MYSPLEAFAVVALRTVFGAIYAGNFSAVMYSFTGGVVSMAVSSLLLCLVHPRVSVLAVSVAAAVAHNITQNVVFVFLSGSALMFGYMPYFGIQAGLFYAREGYSLDEGYEVEGARNAIMDVVELPVLAHCHFDFWKMKLMVNLGFYAGYRLSIHRWGDGFHSDIADSFLPTDRRF